VLVGVPFGPAIDLWSLGCVLAELWMGRPLLQGGAREEVVANLVGVRGPLPAAAFAGGKFWRPRYGAPSAPGTAAYVSWSASERVSERVLHCSPHRECWATSWRDVCLSVSRNVCMWRG
jgi:hypothetical protein